VGRRAIFPALLGAFALAYGWRMSGVADVAPVTDHLSNFYLSGAALTLAATPRGFVDVARRRRVLLVALALVAVNVVAEVLLGIGDIDASVNRAMGGVNTSDPLDGLSGVLGVALVVALLPRPGPGSPRTVPGP
jgi:hypothetical protein